LIVPGHLTGVYHEFFSSNGFFYWGGFGGYDNIYRGYVSPGFLLGDAVYNNPDGNVNANFIADAFANFGHVGVLVTSLLLVLYFIFFDSIARDKPLIFSLMMITIPCVALLNTGFFSSLFSHGLIMSIFCVYLVPKSLFDNNECSGSSVSVN
jgi:hypothetical protein